MSHNHTPLTALIALLLTALLWPLQGHAWPAESDWIELYQNNAPITDPEGDSATSRDIVGTLAYPAAYIYNDGAQMYFRLRLDDDPIHASGGLQPFGWGILIDTDMNADDYEYMIMLDGIVSPEAFYLAKNTTKTYLGDPSDKAEVIVWSQLADDNLVSGNYRVTAATPSDLMGDGNTDYFIEFRIPYNVFRTELGLSDSSLIRYFVGSSNSAQTLSADLLGTDLYSGLSNFVLPNGQRPTSGTVRFVADLAGSGDETQFYVTDTLYVRVDDGDQNAQANSIESLQVTLTTPSGDSETLTLYETGLDTGIFTGSILTDGGPLSSHNGLMEIELIEYVTVTYIDAVDATLTSNLSRTDTIEALPLADLALAKTVDNPTPNEGETITYTLTITNQGPSNSLSAQIEDSLPSGVTYVSHSASSGSYNPASGYWTFGAVAVGATISLTLTTTVDGGTANTTITNSATTVSRGQPDPDPSDDSATVAIAVQGADLQVSKSVNNPAPASGTNVTFTLSVYNAGSNDATNVQLTDLLPSGLAYVSAVGSGSYASGSGVWSIGTLTVGSTATLTLVANVTAATDTTLVNSVAVTAVDQADPVSSNDSASATLYVGAADLQMQKSVNDPTPDEGDTVSYTLTVTNLGPNTAAAVVVDDLLPTGLTYASHSGVGSYNSATGVWSVGTLTTGASAVLTLNATVNANTAGQTLTNSASASSARLDHVSTNNHASAALVVSYADLGVTKTVNNPTPQEGDIITFTLTITNHGVATATNILATDALPPQLLWSGTPSPSSGTFSTATGVWSIPSLASGASATLVFNAEVDRLGPHDPTSFYNTVTIDALDQADPNSSNDSASAAVKVDGVDIAITKVASNTTPAAGSIASVVFTLTATNNGPNTATGIIISDVLPAGVTYNSSTTGYSRTKGEWSISSLAVGATTTLSITVNVNSGTDGTTITNTAGLGSVDQADTNTYNDTASATLYVGGTDLALSKTVDNATPTEGDTLVYSITLTNNGPNTASAIVVTDLLPAGLTYVSHSGGTYVSATGQWAITSLASGASSTLAITATVNSGTAGTTITNSAAITAQSGVDPVSTNNSASISLVVQRVDLVLSKVVNDSTPDEGATTTYTLTLNNLGPHTATGVSVSDLLPAGVTYVSHFSSSGHSGYDAITGTWSIGTLAKSASAVLNITVSADLGSGGSTITNTATVSAQQADSNSTNDSASVDITPVAVAFPNLTILKMAGVANADPGDLIPYTVQVVNAGSGDAVNVTLSDQLSPYTLFRLDTYSGQPFSFSDGASSSGLTLGTPEYSDDNGASWGYTPLSGAGGAPSGYDGNITNWRIVMSGTMHHSGASFTLHYVCQVR